MANLLLTALVIVSSFGCFAFIDISNLRMLASIAGMFLIIKILDWLRLFEITANYVLLIRETLLGVKVFIIMVFLSLMMFGLPIVILNMNREDEPILDDSIGVWFFDMMIN